jgi:hypothetical protein
VNEKVTPIEAGRRALPAIIVGDEGGLRRLAELLAPYLPMPAEPAESDGWMCTREAAEYAGTSTSALHKAMAAREIEFEQEVRGGKAWFRREYVDAWRRGERPARRAA